MDPFEVPDFLDDGALEVPDIDLDVDFDCTDIMDLDCDPDFNSFLRELANEDILQEGCPCCDGAAACDAMCYEKTALNVVTGSGAEDSTSPPRSPAGSSGNESCQYDPTSAAQGGFSYQAGDSVGKYSVGRRATAESEDTKSLRVKERNRLYAARTRQRKNRLLQDLRYRCTYLEAENAQLQARVMHLQGELDCLQSLKGGVIAAPRVSKKNETSPTPSTSTALPVPVSGGPPVLSVKPTPLRKAPNQKTKNKLRFTAAAAAAPCPPQDDASTKMQSSPPVSSSSHGSDSRGTQSSETVADKGTIQSYPGGTSQPVSFKPEPKHSTGLKRSMDSSQTSSGRRVRGKNIASVASSRSQGPLSGMASFGVLALAALSCIVLIALPALSILGSGGGTPDGIETAPSHTHALMASSEDAHFSTRGLLQVGGNEDGLVPYQKLAPEVLHDDEYFLKDEYDDWVGMDDDAHHVLLSAAFICNHTTCVAVPKSGGSWTRVVPQVPVEVRHEDARARNSREATMFSAIGGTGIAGHHHSAHFSAGNNLRGDVPSDDTECTDGDCHDTPPSANEALSMAGLFAPQSCELILRTPGAARRHAVGGDLAPTINSPAHANAVVNTAHRKDAGEVALLKSVLQSADLPSDQKKQLMVSQKMNKGIDQNAVSVLFPAWKSEVEEEGVLTPMRQMYVLVADGADLLTYECSLSRALYI